MNVTYLGTTMLLFDDGKDQILFDCHTTRPSVPDYFFGDLETDTAVADRVIEQFSIDRLRAIFISHTHHDHVMDMPYYAVTCGADVNGSVSAMNVARGGNVAEDRLHCYDDSMEYVLGDYEIRVIPSLHSKATIFNDDLGKVIEKPLVQPAKRKEYTEGGSYDFLVTHRGTRYLIRPSYNFIPGQLNGIRADVLYLGVSGFHEDSKERKKQFFAETIDKVQPKVVIPVHWDNFLSPLYQPIRPSRLGNSKAAMREVKEYCQEKGIRCTVQQPLKTYRFSSRIPKEEVRITVQEMCDPIEKQLGSDEKITESRGIDMKKLGFGLMRLPKVEGVIDIEETKKMVDLFMEAGFTYFDTAWLYAGSEDAIRQALVERYPRESYQLATKLSAWAGPKTKEEAEHQLKVSMERTGTDYFDYYLLHNLGENRSHFYDDFDLWSFVQEKKAEGVFKHVGFSFHSTPEELEEILKAHPEMEFVQLQINYADWDNPAIRARECYEVARKYNKPIIVMEPVKGGTLATPPEAVEKVFKAAEPDSSCASWAVRYAADLEGVMVVLSGMSNVEQMKDNLAYMADFDGLTEEQRQVIAEATVELKKIPLIPCTTCNYCAKVCPNEIGISGTFNAMNILTLYNNMAFAKGQEGWLVGGHGKKHACECIQCGACEDACPQHISIREELVKCAKAFRQV